MSDTTQTLGPSLTIRRTFKAPRERVFAAFTDPAILAQWLGPEDIMMDHVAFDARVGGTLRFVYQSPDWGEMVVTGTVTALRRPEHVAYTWTWEEDDKTEEHESNVAINFIARGDETELHFVHANLKSVESRDRHEGGWTSALDKLERLFA